MPASLSDGLSTSMPLPMLSRLASGKLAGSHIAQATSALLSSLPAVGS